MRKIFEKISQLAEAGGAKQKQKILEENKHDEEFRLFLYYALNPLITYNISEKTLRDTSDYTPGGKLVLFDGVFSCCEYLSRLRGIDNATVRQTKTLIYDYHDKEEQEFAIKLIAKTLRLGVTAKTVNKVIPGLLPEWEVQQAYPIEKYPIKEGTEFWLTEKLNGTRATYCDGVFYARSGAEYTGLEHILNELEGHEGWVLDGELTLIDKGSLSDNEAFRTATGIINSDAESKTEIKFTVFDMVAREEFENPEAVYSLRRRTLDTFGEKMKRDGAKYISVLPVLYHGTDRSEIDRLLDKVTAEDKEGLMLNTECSYKRRRHKGILKIKRFHTMDLMITGYEEGSGRLAGTLGALVLDFEGNEVSVGSGFTDEQRKTFWESREKLIGKICEVKYKEVSSDKHTGEKSLQFPVFVIIREDKTEPSSF